MPVDPSAIYLHHNSILKMYVEIGNHLDKKRAEYPYIGKMVPITFKYEPYKGVDEWGEAVSNLLESVALNLWLDHVPVINLPDKPVTPYDNHVTPKQYINSILKEIEQWIVDKHAT